MSGLIMIFLSSAAGAAAAKCIDKTLNRNRKKQNKGAKTLYFIFFIFLAVFLSFFFSCFTSQKFYPNNLFIFPLLIFYLIAISTIDFKTRIIYDIFSISMLIIGIFLAALNPFLGEKLLDRFFNCFLGAVCGGGILFLFSCLGDLIYKKQTLGGGDIKFMAAAGAFIGVEKIISAVFIGFCLGAIIGLILILFKKANVKGYIPFAPFLSAGIYLSLFID